MNDESFAETYSKFVTALSDVCSESFEGERRGQAPDPYRFLSEAVDDVKEHLTEQDVVDEVQSCADATDDLITRNLQREMHFFITKRESGGYDNLSQAADDGDTIKDSLSSLLTSLPGIIQKLLKILDELLSLVR